MVETKIGVFDHMAVTALILVADVIFSDKKAVDVINTYMARASRVR